MAGDLSRNAAIELTPKTAFAINRKELKEHRESPLR
jgi:hypothetical protein